MVVRTKKCICVFIVFLGMFLCGFLFDRPEMMLDTEKNTVYQHYSIDNLLFDLAEGKNVVKNNYSKARLVLLGKISELSEEDKTVTLSSVSGLQGGAAICSFSDGNIAAEVKTLSQGDIVQAYVKCSINLIGGDLKIDIVKLEKTTINSISDTAYSLLNGKTVDLEKMDTRTLAGNRITYYIPEEWSEAEYHIADNDLGTIEGFQYRLNELPQSPAIWPESLFICYFDNKQLKNSGDKSKTELIERAIIANILNKNPDTLDKFPAKKVDTYYGAKYQYYQDAYRDSLGQGHHVEFVFQPVDTDGIIVYLYVYHDANHVDDILLLMRLLHVS